MFCHDKHVFVTTKVSLWQQSFHHNKIMFVVTNICCNKIFVTTKTCLSWQKKHSTFCRDKRHVLSQQTPVCHNKTLYWWQLPPKTHYKCFHEIRNWPWAAGSPPGRSPAQCPPCPGSCPCDPPERWPAARCSLAPPRSPAPRSSKCPGRRELQLAGQHTHRTGWLLVNSICLDNRGLQLAGQHTHTERGGY